MDKFKVPRKLLVNMLCLAGAIGSLIFTTGSGLFWLDIVDHFLNQYGLVLAGVFECLIIGHILKAKILRKHINETTQTKLKVGWDYLVKYVTPLILIIMLIQSIIGEFSKNYGGYSTASLIGIGVTWLLATAVIALMLSAYPWEPGRLDAVHVPESDTLFK